MTEAAQGDARMKRLKGPFVLFHREAQRQTQTSHF